MLDTIDLQRFAVSAVGALTLSTACVFAAVGPVKAAAPVSTIEAWQTSVERHIDAAMTIPAGLAQGDHATADLALDFDAEGRFKAAHIARTSGAGAIDREALRVADKIAYPRLPESLVGKPRKVRMTLYFGKPADLDQADDMAHEARTLALVAKGDVRQPGSKNVALAGR